MKSLSVVLLLCVALAGCEKSETVIQTSATGKDSVAVGENHHTIILQQNGEQGVINNNNGNGIEVTQTKTSSDNSTDISSFEDVNIAQNSRGNHNSNQVIVSGNDDFVVSQNGRDVDNTNMVISGNNQVIINGVLQGQQKEKTIDIHLTGEKISLPFSNKTTLTLDSSLALIQHCAESNQAHIVVDKAVAPYIDQQALLNGTIRFEKGRYRIQGGQDVRVELYTSKVDRLTLEGLSNMTLTCMNPISATIEKTGTGALSIANLNTKKITLHDSGMGNVTIKNSPLDALDVTKESMGTLKVFSPVQLLILNNSGMGNIEVSFAKQSDITNSGMGNIHISGKTQVLGLENNAMGKIKLD